MIDKKHPILTDLSHELLCHILQYLPLQEVLSISMLCKKLLAAVSMHLRLCKSIDFCEGKIYGYMPSSITDDHMHYLFDKCPHLETVYGLHPLKVERRRLRKRSALTVPGIIEALSLCHNLKSVETSDLRLLEAIMQHLPQLKIIGHFQNRDGVFPPQASQRLKLLPYPRISSLHLIGVEVPELTAMPHLEHLHLQCVRFTKLQPFRAFLATKLKTFVMKHCMGPSLSLRYLSLIIALSSSPALTRLELVRVPLPGGLFQRAVEDSYRHSGFVNLKTLVISGCKGVLEADLGHLMIVSGKNLERVFIQPSLTRDSLFVSLSFAQCEFPKLKDIHLGYVDKLDFSGTWSNDSLVSLGLAEVPDTPSSLTDSGMKVISELFPQIKSMSVSNCPHLMAMDQWSVRVNGELQGWKKLTDLTLQRCHCLQLPSFAVFLAYLPKIEVVILNDMFREPPKGCSHVGLSAGTGLGMSSAVVSNQDEHIAVQGHQQDFELQADEHMENEEMERDFVDVDNEENPDQHILVLQQEFFDEENHVAPPAIMQIENVDPENRIENMEQAVPENLIRRELNEDYDGDDGDSMENNAGSDNDDLNYSLFGISGDESGDESNFYQNPDTLSEEKPLKVSRKVGTDSCDFPVMDSANNACCCESSKHLPCQHIPSPNLFNETMDVDSDEEILTNYNTLQPCNISSVFEDANSSMKKCAHSKICTNKCSKGFDPSQPSTSRDGNCLDCSCLDYDSEMKVGTDVKDVVKSHESGNNHENKNSTSAPVPKKRKKSVEIGELPDEIFKGPLTRNRKRILHQNIKKEPAIPESSNVRTANDDELYRMLFDTPCEDLLNPYLERRSESPVVSVPLDLPIKTEPLDHEYDLNENPSCNQDVNKKDECRNHSEENLGSGHDKQKARRNEGRNRSEENVGCGPDKQRARRNRSEENVGRGPDKQRARRNESKNRSEGNIGSGPDKQKRRRNEPRNRSEEDVDSGPDKQRMRRNESRNRSEENVDSRPDKQRTRRNESRNRSEENVDSGPDKQRTRRNESRNRPEENVDSGPDKQRTRRNESKNRSEENVDSGPDKQRTRRDECSNRSEENVDSGPDKQRAKKHKRHKHKKSKKSSKSGKLSRKKGPVTRSRSNRYLHDGHDIISQGTQATSADIRRTLRRQRNCSVRCKRKGSGACGSSHRRSHNHISARQVLRRPKQSNPNVELQNKSTSTSDPLMEDDAVQTLRLVSETLISITIISCGVSDIFIDHCHSLSHVEVQACRILKMFQISWCPCLKRFNISQCPKLTLEVLVPEVLSLVPTKKLLVSFEPCMQIYYPSDTEKIIFSKAPLDQSIILFHDFTNPANEAVQATSKENLLRWMEIIQKMYYSPMYMSFYKFWLLRQRQKKKKKGKVKFRDNRVRYPYGHSLRRIHGIFPIPLSTDPDCGKEGRYQILTNDHVFASALENKSWNKGFPAPEACEDYTEDDALLSMIESEYTERKLKMRKKIVSFYIPTVSESN